MKRLERELKRIKVDLEMREKRRGNISPISYSSFSSEQDCLCTDRGGEYKVLYREYRDALSVCNSTLKELGIRLKIYPCRYVRGWHISKG